MEDSSPPITPVIFRTRLHRNAYSDSSCVLSSPRDSGYDSESVIPHTPPSQGSDYLPHFKHLDGNDSSDFSSASDGTDPVTPPRSSPITSPGAPSTQGRECPDVKRSATIPRSGLRPRCNLPSAFFSSAEVRKTTRRSSDVGPGRGSAPFLRHPDRFVHSRDFPLSSGDKFRTGKLSYELTNNERLLRHKVASPDPFFAPLRQSETSPTAARQARMSHTSHTMPRMRAATILQARGTSDGPDHTFAIGDRLPSGGSVWSIGGVAPSGGAIDDGHGHLIMSGSNAPLFRTTFTLVNQKAEEEQRHEGRIAAALDLDLASRILDVKPLENRPTDQSAKNKQRTLHSEMSKAKTFFNGVNWVKEGAAPTKVKPVESRNLQVAPFKVLDAPNLRDDFYCSVLAYSSTCHTLAIGLGDFLYSWSEATGVKMLNGGAENGTWLTSVDFSSSDGCKSILAFGRNNSMLGLVSMYESGIARMVVQEASPISCVSWRPVSTLRPSRNPNRPGVPVRTEDLLVGDESGHILYYVVEWPDVWEVERDGWQGEMILMARISAHRQQICGLAWSRDGRVFASGGNDNLCSLFEVDRLLRVPSPTPGLRSIPVRGYPVVNNLANGLAGVSLLNGHQIRDRPQLPAAQGYPGPMPSGPFGSTLVQEIGPTAARCRWEHGAAVKAIAFCPWQDGLVATGGGSNDKCIHFFHTTSGAALATIAVSAQVTSLIWSTTRREIAATFGYAQPEHPVRIAVFSWPDCNQVATIPWEGEHRALYAISYPRGPVEVGRDGRIRSSQEGCIVVAASDESVKFHEVWSPEDGDARTTTGGVGMLGGSDILEDLEGIDKEGDVIR